MSAWQYKQPVEILFKTGFLAEIGRFLEERRFKNGLLICDEFFISNGKADEIIAESNGRLTGIFSDIRPNPTIGNVDACIKTVEDANAEFAVAFGGGSVIDCAKIACLLAKSNVPAALVHKGDAALPASGIPLIAIPTTAGTGSEVTGVSVLTDDTKGIKAPIAGDALYPKIAIIDPVQTISLPASVTAATGMDVLAHALESFWSKNHQPICDALAIEAARLTLEALPVAFRDGSNLQARTSMCEASLIAGLAFAVPKTAGAHACSFRLTNIYNMPHGEACAFTLAAFTRINSEAESGRLHWFAEKLGFADAYKLADHIDKMKNEMGLKTTLSQAGISVSDLPALAEKCRHPNLNNNPVTMSDNDVIAMFKTLA